MKYLGIKVASVKPDIDELTFLFVCFGRYRGAQSGNKDDQNVLSAHAGRKHYQSYHRSADGNDSFGETGVNPL